MENQRSALTRPSSLDGSYDGVSTGTSTPIATIRSDLEGAEKALDAVEGRLLEIRGRLAGDAPRAGGKAAEIATNPSVFALAGQIRRRVDGLFGIIAEIENTIG